MNFEEWKSEADMPRFVNGEWVDLETGIPFKSRARIAIDARRHLSKANALGGIALTGSAKQKIWAEKIRAGEPSTHPTVPESLGTGRILN